MIFLSIILLRAQVWHTLALHYFEFDPRLVGGTGSHFMFISATESKQ